ncbi:MAG TPA: hypothetical protein VLS49_01010 [Usitatibacter sp.]|nr:hypothetical protein [Usitatibacter sp.]
MLERWDDRLSAARTEHEVLDIARDVIASLDSFEIAQLPVMCRPRRLDNANDVCACAFDLIQYEPTPDDTSYHVVHKLGIFFAAAANRLAHIHAPVRKVEDWELGLKRRQRTRQ